jgi:hypothetical protein
MGWLAGALELLRIVSSLVGWWTRLDENTRKEIRAAHQKLLEAEKHGKQAEIRSAINRLNGAL